MIDLDVTVGIAASVRTYVRTYESQPICQQKNYTPVVAKANLIMQTIIEVHVCSRH